MTKLQSALRLAKQGFKLFPIIPNSKKPAVNEFYSKATTDETILKRWFDGKDYNIGISTDTLIVVDIDVKPEKNGFESVKKLADEGKKLPATFQQKSPTGSVHLIYRAPFPVKNSVSKIGLGIDIRGFHGFVVGAGSTINGKEYEIRSDKPVANAPEWLIEMCEQENGEAPHAREVVVEIDPKVAWERGKELLSHEPTVTEGERNAAAYRTANKLKDVGVNEGDTFALMLEYWKCEPLLEYNELASAVRSAFKYGKEGVGSKAPEAMFGDISQDVKQGKANPVLALNDEYAFIRVGGKHVILHETTDADGNFKADFLEESTFHALHASRIYVPDGARPEPLTRMWMKNPGRRTYEGLVFKPEQKVAPRFYNLWRGFAVKEMLPTEPVTDAMKRAYDAFTSHLFENVANKNEAHFNWVMGWFAHMLQRPWEKPGTALVLRGRKGVGKNAIFETFRPMFPSHYLVTGDRRYLVSNFNAHLERLLLFVADEAFWSGDKSSEGILKSLITDPRAIIEKKGKDVLTIESNHRIAILGNEGWVVPASQDERRYAVFEMGETRKQDRVFFGGMDRDMRNGGTRYLFTKLRHFDLGTVDVRQIPSTEGLAKQKLRSMGLVEQWWYDSLFAGLMPNVDSDAWPHEATLPLLKHEFREYAKSRGRGQWLGSDDEFLTVIKTVCPSVKVRRGTALTITLPSLEECRAIWDLYMGSDTAWV